MYMYILVCIYRGKERAPDRGIMKITNEKGRCMNLHRALLLSLYIYVYLYPCIHIHMCIVSYIYTHMCLSVYVCTPKAPPQYPTLLACEPSV